MDNMMLQEFVEHVTWRRGLTSY